MVSKDSDTFKVITDCIRVCCEVTYNGHILVNSCMRHLSLSQSLRAIANLLLISGDELYPAC